MKILLQQYKQLLSYDTANTLKIGDFFALTWSTFAGPVTNVTQWLYLLDSTSCIGISQPKNTHISLNMTETIDCRGCVTWKIKQRHQAEMANIAQGKAECYITIEAQCRVLYFTYSMRKGNGLSVIKIFLNIHLPPLNQTLYIPSLLTQSINYINLDKTSFAR